jgi:hypothetical protein
MNNLVNLLDLDADALTAYCGELGEKPFRARQLQRWIHQFGASHFDAMTDLAKSLREKLATRAEIRSPAAISDNTSSDGTRKWLLDVGAGNAVETVYIPEDTAARCACRRRRVRRQLPVLFDRQAGFFAQSLHRRDHRPALDGRVRDACPAGSRPQGRACHLQCGDDGHGRAAAQL